LAGDDPAAKRKAADAARQEAGRLKNWLADLDAELPGAARRARDAQQQTIEAEYRALTAEAGATVERAVAAVAAALGPLAVAVAVAEEFSRLNVAWQSKQYLSPEWQGDL